MRRQGHWTYKYLFKTRHESGIEVSWVYQSCQSINENYWARTLWGKQTEGRKMTMETQRRGNDRTASACSRERWKQTCSLPKWKTAESRSHWSPQADGAGLLPRGIPWTMPLLRCGGGIGGPDEYFINASKACGQDFESFKETVIETKICGKQRLKEPKQLPSSRKGNIRFLAVWQTRSAKVNNTRRGF